MFLLGQSFANIEAPHNKRLDGKALASEWEVNTPIKFVDRAQDKRTAESTEYPSTQQQPCEPLCVAQRETSKPHTHGGEPWEGHRMVGSQQAPIISATTARHLPRRVAIGFMPGRFASKVFTHPTRIENREASWQDMPPGTRASAPAGIATPAP